MSDRDNLSPALAGVQLADEGHLSRGEVLLKGTLAVAGLYGVGAIGPFARRALADAKGDVEQLNYLLSFEVMQQTLYKRGQTERNYRGEKMPLKSSQKELIDLLVTQENEHVAALEKLIEVLGGEPKVLWHHLAFTFLDFETLLLFAGEVESASIGAFNGAIPTLESREAREIAFSIVQVDGRHAAAVVIPLNEEPAPEAFDLGIDETSALSLTEQFTGIFAE